MGHNIGEEVNCFYGTRKDSSPCSQKSAITPYYRKVKMNLYNITFLYNSVSSFGIKFSACDEDYNEPFLGVANFFTIAI